MRDVGADRPGRRPRPLRLVLIGIGWMLASLSGLVILLWLAGRILTDRFAWSQWLWWIPTPVALAFLALGIAASLRPSRRPSARRWRLARWTLALSAVSIHFLAVEHHLLRRGRPGGDGLRLAHWNVSPPTGSHLEPSMQAIMTIEAEILVLTNAAALIGDERLVARAGQQPLFVFGPLTLATSLPVTRFRPLVATEGMWIVLAEIDTSERLGRPTVMYLVDFPSNPRWPRMPMARKARRLLDELQAPPPDIVVGDFNIARASASIDVLFPGMRHAFDDAGSGYGATFHRLMPMWHIDNMLLDADAAVARYELIDLGMSRHRAQRAWLKAANLPNPGK